MNIFGIIEIEKKTDVLAFTAFIISVLTAIYQLGLFVFGPSAQFLLPEGVTIARFDNRPGQSFISVIAPISIANTSDAREPLLVSKQTATVRIGDRSIPLTWHDIVEAPISDGTIQFSDSRAVSPFVVDTKGISSKLIRFTPQRVSCDIKIDSCNPNQAFVPFDEFRSIFLTSIQNSLKFIEVEFAAEFKNHKKIRVTCKVQLIPNQLKLLRNLGYFMELC